MKKLFTFVILLILLLFSLCLNYPVEANIMVSPAEVYITMNDSYINGNTTKKITVTNNYPYDITVKTEVIHPDPSEWIRQGKTKIENLSWITIEPNQTIISANSTGYLYIHLSIPEISYLDNLGKHWETWLNIKPEAQGLFNVGYSIRVFIDTPTQLTFPYVYYLIVVGIIIFLGSLLLTTLFLIKQKKKKKTKR